MAIRSRKLKDFLFEHSLSIAMGIGFVVSCGLFFVVDQDSRWYDFFNMVASCFGGSLVIILLAQKFWEKNSDPSEPPEDKEQ